MNLWPSLSENRPSPRNEILHNIDDIWGSAALTVGKWKVLKGTNYNGFWDKWYGPAGNRQPSAYSTDVVLQCAAGKALAKLDMLPSAERIRTLRADANVECYLGRSNETDYSECLPLAGPCLFNIHQDPCELNNVAER